MKLSKLSSKRTQEKLLQYENNMKIIQKFIEQLKIIYFHLIRNFSIYERENLKLYYNNLNLRKDKPCRER